MKEKIVKILKEYSCWTPKEHYGCIPKLADEILEITKQELEETMNNLGDSLKFRHRKQLEAQKQEFKRVVGEKRISDGYLNLYVSELMRNKTITTPEFAIKVVVKQFNQALSDILKQIETI